MHAKRFRTFWFRRKIKCKNPMWIPVVCGIVLTGMLIRYFNSAVRPQVIALSEMKLQNQLTMIANRAIAQVTEEQMLTYDSVMALQMMGETSVFVANPSVLNQLKYSVLDNIIMQLGEVEQSISGIPLGTLSGIDLLSGVGSKIPVKVLSVASVQGQYRNDFISAGINQTLHRIMLDITLMVTLLLPGGTVEISVSSPVCVVEAVIIGQVPQNYLSQSS